MAKSLVVLFITLVILVTGSIACDPPGGVADQHFDAGMTAFQEAGYEQARDEFQAALEGDLNQHNVEEVYYMLGRTYDMLDQFDEAIAAYEKATEINPDYVDAWVGLGIAYRLTGEYDKAEEAYNKALELEPNAPEIYGSLGALEIARGNPDKALPLLEKAIELDSELAVAHSNLAYAYALLGRFDEADAELALAIELGYENSEEMQALIDELKTDQ